MKRLISGVGLAVILAACGSMNMNPSNSGGSSQSSSIEQKSESETTETKDPLDYYKGLDEELEQTRSQHNEVMDKVKGNTDGGQYKLNNGQWSDDLQKAEEKRWMGAG